MCLIDNLGSKQLLVKENWDIRWTGFCFRDDVVGSYQGGSGMIIEGERPNKPGPGFDGNTLLALIVFHF